MEKVTYKGRVYSRDPNAKNKSHQLYYRRKKYDSRSKKYVQTILHRVIWEDAHGPIPWDHIIHHIDGDSNNNKLDNLGCIPVRDHLSKYHGEGKYKNAVEKPCMRCGILFKAKTKRSHMCLECSNIIHGSFQERIKWYNRKEDHDKV
jgi:hypothetical protein